MTRMMWQGFGSSNVLHVVDVERPVAKKSGPRTLCGSYPGKSYSAWFSLDIEELTEQVQRVYDLRTCLLCVNELEKAAGK